LLYWYKRQQTSADVSTRRTRASHCSRYSLYLLYWYKRTNTNGKRQQVTAAHLCPAQRFQRSRSRRPHLWVPPHFAYFTGTKVQILTRIALSSLRRRAVALCVTLRYVSIRQHTSAYVSILAYFSIRQHKSASGLRRRSFALCVTLRYVSIRQHTSAYVSIRQHISILQHTSA
jgi:hypothetical protein